MSSTAPPFNTPVNMNHSIATRERWTGERRAPRSAASTAAVETT